MSSDTSSSGHRLAEIVALFLDAAACGQPPDREQLLLAHPDLAEDLRAFFADHDRMTQAAAPVRAALDDDAARTGPPPENFPQAFGDYELLEEIGRGGMGVVYKARQISLHRIVALKRIRAGQLASAEEVARFRREAEAAAGLDQSHIVPILEVGEHHGQHYFTMKLIEGGNLNAHLAEYAADAKATAALMIAIARAVHHAHQRGILHRDLKPGNILIDADGSPHVSDFGLAQPIEKEAKLTQSGAIVGTAETMAPEQARGEKGLTTAADVYGLGAILYVLLTGRPPFQGDYNWETLKKVVEEEPPAPRSLNRKANHDLETICLKCLAKQPARRYGSAEALAEELERWRDGKPILARPVTARERIWKWAKRHPAGSALCAVCLLSLAALAGGILFHRSRVSEAEGGTRDVKNQLDSALTRHLLGSVGGKEGAVGPAERDALLDLASQPNDELRLACLKEALGKEDQAERLKRRPEMVVRAVVGLDSNKRKKCLDLAHWRFRSTKEGSQVKAASALLAVELGSRDNDILFAAAKSHLFMFVESPADERSYPDARSHLAEAKELAGQLDRPSANSFALIVAQNILREPGFILEELLEAVFDKLNGGTASSILYEAVDAVDRTSGEEHTRFHRAQMSSRLIQKVVKKAELRWRLAYFRRLLQQTHKLDPSHPYLKHFWRRDFDAFWSSLNGKEAGLFKSEFSTHGVEEIVKWLHGSGEKGAIVGADFDRPISLPAVLVSCLDAKGVAETAQAIAAAFSSRTGGGRLGVLLGPDDSGVKLLEVSPGGAASKAGLKAGDVILLVAGEEVLEVDAFIAMIQNRKAGETVTLKVKRQTLEMEVKVILDKPTADEKQYAHLLAHAMSLGKLAPRLTPADARMAAASMLTTEFLDATVSPKDTRGNFQAALKAVAPRLGQLDAAHFAAAIAERMQGAPSAQMAEYLALHLTHIAPFVKGAEKSRPLTAAVLSVLKKCGVACSRETLAECGSQLLSELPPREQADAASEFLNVIVAERKRPKEPIAWDEGWGSVPKLAKTIADRGTKEQAKQAVQLLAEFVESNEFETGFYVPTHALPALANLGANEETARLAASLASKQLQHLTKNQGGTEGVRHNFQAVAPFMAVKKIDELVLTIIKELERLDRETYEPPLTGKDAIEDVGKAARSANALLYSLHLSCLSPLIPRIDAKTRNRLVESLLLRNPASADGMHLSADVTMNIEALAKQLDSGDARQVLERVLPRLKSDSFWKLASGIKAVVGRVDLKDREKLVPIFLAALPVAPLIIMPVTSEIFARMLSSLPPDVARKAARASIERMEKGGTSIDVRRHQAALKIVSASLEKSERDELHQSALLIIASRLGTMTIEAAARIDSSFRLLEELISNADSLDEKATNNLLLYLATAVTSVSRNGTPLQMKESGFDKVLLVLARRCSSAAAGEAVAAFPKWYSRTEHKHLPRLVIDTYVNKLEPELAAGMARVLQPRIRENYAPMRIALLEALLARLDRTEAERLARPIVEKAIESISPILKDGRMQRGYYESFALSALLFNAFARYEDEAKVKALWRKWLLDSASVLRIRTPVDPDFTDADSIAMSAHVFDLLAGQMDAREASDLEKNLAHRRVCRLAEGGWRAQDEAGRRPLERMELPGIVEALKNPLCVGPVRAGLLKELGRRCGQPFANVWEFIEWAEANQPALDLRAPLSKL